MAGIDYSKYVFQPRPLQQYDFGRGFRDIIEARFGREKIDNQKQQAEAQLGEQRAGRADVNTRYASLVAEGRSDTQIAAQTKLQAERDAAAQKARQLFVSGDRNGARALLGRIAELGGEVEWTQGPNGEPDFIVKSPNTPLPQRNTDTRQVRSEIFGGAQQPSVSPSFQAPSPFNAGGQPGPVRNPFAAPAAPTAPAQPPAQLPTAPAQPAQPGIPGEAAAAASADAQAAVAGLEASVNGGAPPAAPPVNDGFQQRLQAAINQPAVAGQLAQRGVPVPQFDQNAGARNPFNPYRLSGSEITDENNARMKPYFEGIQGAVPAGFRTETENFHNGVKKLGYGPEDTLKLIQPTFNTLAGLYKNGISAEAASQRAAISGENAELGRNIRLENRMFQRADKIVQNTGLKTAIEKLQVSRGAEEQLKLAKSGNGQATTQLVAQLHRMNQSGVMTDKDFEHASTGAVTIWQKIKDGTIQNLIQNGLSLDQAAAIQEVLTISRRAHVQSVQDAQRQLWTQVVRAGSDEERKSAEDAIMQLIPQEYWSPEVREAFGMDVAQKTGNVDRDGNYTTNPPPRGGAQPAGKVSASSSSSTSKRGPKDDGLDEYK